ncbi:MAG: hypothetical protein HZB35_02010 [Nitrospirae bacterium]|nr:hypothetical protein [Nitrospirota bacterium]
MNKMDGSPQDFTGKVVRPRLLKNTAPQRFINVKIGQLGVELWEYRDPNREPFARLIIEGSSSEKRTEESAGPGEDDVDVELDVWHATSLSTTIESWLAALVHVPRTSRQPSLRAQIDLVFLTLHHPLKKGIAPNATVTLCNTSGQVGTVTLTDLEAGMLSNTLQAIHEDVQKAE